MPRGRPPGSVMSSSSSGMLDGRPKGKMTAYAFFVQTCRQEFRRKFPDEHVDLTELSRKCADRWKTMSEKEKRRFNQVQ